MSLEAAIEKLTEAVAANTALLQTLADRAAANGAAKPAAATVAAAEETVNSPVAPPAAERRGPGRPPKASKVKTITEEQLRAAFGGYLAGSKEKAVRDERKLKVGAILQHFGVDRATEIPEENRAEALTYVAELEAGRTPDFMNEEAADEVDEDEDAMI